MITLTRRYHFPAAHVLARPDFSHERNLEIYGKCANPAGHGHNYGVEVTVGGAVDPASGHIVPPQLLDEIVEAEVVARFGHGLLNDDPAFRERVPTAENIAVAIHEQLEGPLEARSRARLVRVRVRETRRNSCEYEGPLQS